MTIAISHLLVSPGHDFKGRHGQEALNHGIEDREEIECVSGKGIVGDRYFGFEEDFKGQITFFDLAVYESVKTKFSLSELAPSAFRRNVMVSGLDLNTLIGKRFTIDGVEFEGSEEAKPCYWMDQACAPGVEEFLRGKGGLRARIRQGGVLRKGPAEVSMG